MEQLEHRNSIEIKLLAGQAPQKIVENNHPAIIDSATWNAVQAIEYVSFHTLRHTFATRAIEAGADVKTVSEVLGHSNTMITVNRYTHSLFEQKRRLMDKLNALYKRADTTLFSSAIS